MFLPFRVFFFIFYFAKTLDKVALNGRVYWCLNVWRHLRSVRWKSVPVTSYRVCQGFRLTKRDDFFELILTTFEASIIFEAAGAVVEISLSPHNSNRNQVKLAQIRETHCSSTTIIVASGFKLYQLYLGVE